MAKHAQLAPSSASRWVRCPGSVALVATLPPGADPPNNNIDWGTACHAMLEDTLTMGGSARQFIGESYTVIHDAPYNDAAHDYHHKFTAEDAVNVDSAVDYIRKRMDEYRRPATVDAAGIEHLAVPATLLVEKKVDPGSNFHTCPIPPEMWDGGVPPDSIKPAPRDDCTGTADAIMFGNGILEVVDYKNGVGYVEHEGNVQLLLYMLGALKLIKAGDVQRIRLTIVQPRALRAGVEPVRTWEFPASDAPEYAVRFGVAAARVTPDAPRIPGDEQCQWCPAKSTCPEVAGAVAEVMGVTPAPAPAAMVEQPAPSAAAALDDGDSITDLAAKPADALTPEQRRTVLDNADLIRGWLKAVEAHALAQALKGIPTAGYKVVEGKGSRDWVLGQDDLAKKFGQMSRIGEDGKAAGKLRQSDYLETPKVLSPAQAEKRIKPLVSDRTWKNIAPLIVRTEGKPALVSESDTRPALELESAAEAFGIESEVDSGQSPAQDTPVQLDFLN